MTSFLFWNIKGNSSPYNVANLARQHDVDVIMLAECQIKPGTLLVALNQSSLPFYHYASGMSLCKAIEMYTRFPPEFVKPVLEVEKATIRDLKLPGRTSILLAATHLPSKLYRDDADQLKHGADLAELIQQAEKHSGHKRTILVGDLNMDPYEKGMVASHGLNSVMSRAIAQKGQKKVSGLIESQQTFFYNPMWSLFGDGSPGPSGTYYYGSSKQYWHLFDQLLIRPDLLNNFKNEDLMILGTVGQTSLLSQQGVPNKNISDHLPILFRLDL